MDFIQLSKAMAESYVSLSPQLRRAADYALNAPEDVALLSMRRLADCAGVPPSTMNRLARHYGFDGFVDFRRVFQSRVRHQSAGYGERARGLQDMAGQVDDLVNSVHNAGRDNLDKAFQNNAPKSFLNAAKVLASGHQVFIVGMRSCYPIARYFNYVYGFFRNNGHLLDTEGGAFADGLRSLESSDVIFAISFHPYSRETLSALEFAKSRGCKMVVLTDNPLSPLIPFAEAMLIVDNWTPSFFHSLAPALAVVEALIAVMVAEGGEKALNAIMESERQLADFDAYWQSAKVIKTAHQKIIDSGQGDKPMEIELS